MESGQGMAKSFQKKGLLKQADARASKLHVNFWKKRVFRPSYSTKEGLISVPEYSVKMQFGKRRHTFPLQTAELGEAGNRARDIYLAVSREGWDEALERYRPGWGLRKNVLTFGE